MNKCPKCGGTNGFTYLFTMTTSRSGDWGVDNDEETDVVSQKPVNSVKCVDCGKRIGWDTAHGFEGGRTMLAPDLRESVQSQ